MAALSPKRPLVEWRGKREASLFGMATAAALLVGRLSDVALATPAPVSSPPQIVRLSATWFSADAPPVTYRFGIYATGVDRNAVIAFDRDTLVPIENAASIDAALAVP